MTTDDKLRAIAPRLAAWATGGGTRRIKTHDGINWWLEHLDPVTGRRSSHLCNAARSEAVAFAGAVAVNRAELAMGTWQEDTR